MAFLFGYYKLTEGIRVGIIRDMVSSYVKEGQEVRIYKGKLVAFFLIVLITLAIVATTTGTIWTGIKKGLDIQGGFEVLYEADPGQHVNAAIMGDAAKAIEKRVNIIGVSEPEITVEGQDRIRVQLAGVKDEAKARELLGKPAQLTFRAPDGKTILIKGSDLQEGGASVQYDQNNLPVVSLKVKDAKKLADVTAKYIGQPMPIFLDDKELSSPVIQSVITNGEAQITGNHTLAETQGLVDLLNAGSIPIKLHEVESQAVDASLGAASLQVSIVAGAFAIVAIFLFVIGNYRLPGFIAVITLIAYAYLILLSFWLLNVTLTLPGIAAFILGIGIAVDANIIMSERIKEELRIGKSIPAATRVGSRRSFLTIFDAHITTLIAGIALFSFGTSSVKGFSVSLIAGILVSFLTAVAMSRIMMTLLVRSNILKNPSVFSVKGDEISDLYN